MVELRLEVQFKPMGREAMKKKKDEIPILKIRKGATLREIYARAREQFSAADLQKFTEIEEGIPAEQVLAKMEEIHRQFLPRKKVKPSHDAATRKRRAALAGASLQGGGRFLASHPASGHRRRMWPRGSSRLSSNRKRTAF
jgi:hypothetical protein